LLIPSDPFCRIAAEAAAWALHCERYATHIDSTWLTLHLEHNKQLPVSISMAIMIGWLRDYNASTKHLTHSF
jgi:hypothetical protein